MAKPKAQPQTEPPKLLVARSEAEARLTERIEKGKELAERTIQSESELKQAQNDFFTWSDFNVELLRRIFTTSEFSDRYNSSAGFVIISEQPLYQEIESFREDVQRKIRKLESVRERLELIPTAETMAPTEDARPVAAVSRKVFVVHGHDEAAREKAARFLERLNLSPIILHEQANAGRTLIEKFETFSDVGFAVVLLTPDDVGAAAGDTANLKSRARQNVIFELGFFIGRLGRNHGCALHGGGVELPSDFHGVVYVDFDAGGAWQLRLAKELKEAGIPVDMNKAL